MTLVRYVFRNKVSAGGSEHFKIPRADRPYIGFSIHNVGASDIYFNFDGDASSTSGAKTGLVEAGSLISDTQVVFTDLDIYIPTAGGEVIVCVRLPLSEDELIHVDPSIQIQSRIQIEKNRMGIS